MKKIITIIMIALIAFILGGLISYLVSNRQGLKEELPKPELADGVRGTMFGIDKNINEETIDDYLNRDDSVYLDMRMLIDEGDYESIGGDSYLSGIVKGFEAIPLPLIVNVTGLPEAVGNIYQGATLFTLTEGGEYIANYKESVDFLEYYFPKDKNIFLMCGGGGYAGMMKTMLIALGWSADKIYNVGGYWYYSGSNNIVTKRTVNENNVYDFWKITYHDIDFSLFQKVS